MSKNFSLEQTVKQIVEHINEVCKEGETGLEYGIEYVKRDRLVTMLEASNKMKPKRQYYGVLLFWVKEGKEQFLLWRQEYIFFNLTDSRNDFLWREKLSMGLMYEALGIMAAVTRSRIEPGKETYDFKTDLYIKKDGTSTSGEIGKGTSGSEEVTRESTNGDNGTPKSKGGAIS